MQRLLVTALGLGAAIFAAGAVAQSYPTKPVKLIVTYPPGGSSDLMSRVFGQKLSEIWAQPVIIESKPGAAGSIGMDFAASRRPTATASWSATSGRPRSIPCSRRCLTT